MCFFNSCGSPLMYFGLNFHTLWLQFLLHEKFPLLSYDMNTVSLNDKDVKSSRRVSSEKTLSESSEAAIRSCS